MSTTALPLMPDPVLSRQRYRRAALAAATAAVSKVASVAAHLAIMPLMLSHLGVDRYGILLTLQSLLGLTALVDLGIPNAALNALAASAARQDGRQLGRLASTALAMLCGIAAAVLVAVVVGWWALPWPNRFLATDPALRRDIALGVAVFAAAFAVAVPLGFVESFSTAFQQASVVNVARTAAAIGTLLATGLAFASGAPFVAVCLAVVGPTLLAWLAAWLVALAIHPEVRLGLAAVTPDVGRSLVRSGLAFYGIQLCAALGFGADNLLISTVTADPETVTSYAVPQRIFSLVLVAATVCLAPLWPAYADARARGDDGWIARTFRLSVVATTLLSSLAALAVALALPWLTGRWLAGAVTCSPLMAAGLAALTACQCLGTAVAVYWNGTGQLRLQFLLGFVFILVALPLKWLAIGRLGVDWLPAVTTAAYACVILLPAAVLSASAAVDHGRR